MSKLNYELKGISFKYKEQKPFFRSKEIKESFKQYTKFKSRHLDIRNIETENPEIDVLIKCLPAAKTKLNELLHNQTFIDFSEYSFALGTISINNLNELSKIPEVISVEPSMKLRKLLDTSVDDINANDVWTGNTTVQLDTNIDGTGVYVGIIDGTPFEEHITFKDEYGNSRIKEKFNVSGSPDDHGTHVGGIAAGRGDADTNRGVAYNSNILFGGYSSDDFINYNDYVSITSNTFLKSFYEMVSYVGQSPLIVNASLGWELGPHDGTTNFEQAINGIILENEVALVVSAGNAGDQGFGICKHYRDSIAIGEAISFTILDYDFRGNNVPELKIEIWYGEGANLDVQVEVDGSTSSWVMLGQEETWFYHNTDRVSISNYGPDVNNNDNVITLGFNDIIGDNIYIPPNLTGIVINLRNNGNANAIIDAYSREECSPHAPKVSFFNGDSHQTLSLPATSAEVITVTAYDEWNGLTAHYSSQGPLRIENGITKPDITAPGSSIFSAMKNGGYGLMSGTSMAAPHVTGAIALLLQNFKELSPQEIKDILKKSAFNNGNMPKERWGAGKLDILAAYEYMVGYMSGIRKAEFKNAFELHKNSTNNSYFNKLTGLPIEEVISYNGLQKQEMTNGALVLVSNNNLAFWLSETIWNKWEELGNVSSSLGMPVSTEYVDNENKTRVDFENGYLYLDGNGVTIGEYPVQPAYLAGRIIPEQVFVNSAVDFKVLYVDPSNQAPQNIYLVLDEVEIPINYDGYPDPSSTTWEEGVEYTYTHSFNGTGTYNYYFKAFSAIGDNIREPDGFEDQIAVILNADGWDIRVADITAIPTYMTSGQDVLLRVFVNNNSDSPDKIYTNVDYRFELYNPSGNLIDESSGTIASLSQGQTITISEYLTTENTEGNYRCIFTVTNEKDEDISNNTISKSLIVGQDGPTRQYLFTNSDSWVYFDENDLVHEFGDNTYELTYIYDNDYIRIKFNSESAERINSRDFREFDSKQQVLYVEECLEDQYAYISFGTENPNYVEFVNTNISGSPGEDIYFDASCSATTFVTNSRFFAHSSGDYTNIEAWFVSEERYNSNHNIKYHFNIPSGTSPGIHTFWIMSELNNDYQFLRELSITVLPPAPEITGLSASSFAADDQVIISGNNFGSSGTARLNDLEGIIGSWSGTGITITIPDGVSSGNLTIVNNGGVSNPVAYSITSSTGQPEILNNIPSQNMNPGETRFIGDLNQLFWDPNGDALTYNVTSDNDKILINDLFLSDGMLYVSTDPEIRCNGIVTITVSDLTNSPLVYSFTIKLNYISPYIEADPDTITIKSSQVSRLFDIASNTDWIIMENVEWLNASRTNNRQMTVYFDENTSNTYRTGNVYLSAANKTTIVNINQLGQYNSPPSVSVNTLLDEIFSTSSVTVSGMSSDSDGEVRKLLIKVNDDPWTEINGELSNWQAIIMLKQGENNVFIKAIDNSGLESEKLQYYPKYYPNGDNIFYVATFGSNLTGDGSVENPYASIQRGIDMSSAGDRVYVLPGTYFENVVMKSGISVTGAGCQKTIISGECSGFGVVLFDHVNNIVFEGFTLTVSNFIPGVGRAFLMNALDNKSTIRNCIIRDVQYGIFVNENSSPLLENNTFVNGEQAIYIDGGSEIKIINNIIYDYNYGIHFVNPVNPNQIAIKYNTFYSNSSDVVGLDNIIGNNGNFNSNPLFSNNVDRDLSLTCKSPCIDAGSPELPLDPDGTNSDIGAIYYNKNTPCLLEQDSLALVALYNSTAGNNWTNKDNWLTGSLNTWYGVTLNNGRVTGLNLSNNNLTGSIPLEFYNLTNVVYLYLGTNNLSCTISPMIGQLANLRSFNVWHNQLNGIIPEELFFVTNLMTLHLDYNDLSGTISPLISNLNQLSELGLGENNLENPIPVELFTLSEMGYLNLAANNFSGLLPDGLWNLIKLQYLFIADNEFTGLISPSIGNLNLLRSFNARMNNLEGTIPESIANLDSLEWLILDQNDFSDFPNISSFQKLKNLWIQNNSLAFEDIESNIGIPSDQFYYSPQSNIGEEQFVHLDIGDSFNMNVTCGGTHNQYQWFKNWQPIPGAQSTEYQISNALPTDAGDYHCQVTNTVATDLTIYSQPIHISVYDPAIVTDSLALVAFYNATDGPNWTNHDNWLTGPLNTWYGVYLEGGRVTELSFWNNNITGVIPSEIGNLNRLTFLSLAYNNLSGQIPSEIGNLTNLTGLNLCGNQLTGDLPAGIYSMSSLTQLGLNYNSITNIDLQLISNMNQLQYLQLSGLNLTGTLPSGLFLLPGISHLDLANNAFTGEIPTELYYSTSLYFINLGGNQISGVLSPEIANLTNLRYLYLYYNQLSGSIPDEINQLPLEYMDISSNQFTDLPVLDGLTNLQGLWMGDNYFTFEDIEPNIGRPASYFYYSPQKNIGEPLTINLDEGENYSMSVTTGGNNNLYLWFKDGIALPSAQTNSYLLQNVTEAETGSYTCQVTNTIATDLTLYSYPINIFVKGQGFVNDSLALVALYNATDGPNWTNRENWLTGPLNTWYGIGMMGGRVTQLDLWQNNLTGVLPPELGNLTELNYLWLGYNQLSGTIPAELGNLTKLVSLDIPANQLSGDLPNGVYALENLIVLNLSYNSISSIDLIAIGQMYQMHSLGLANLNVQGELPVHLFNMPNLGYLDLSYNGFTGTIPASVGNMSSLYSLNLSGNQLNGTIPPEIGNLINLNSLYLGNNNFEGPIPVSINQTSLEWLQIENNHFSELPCLEGLLNLRGLFISNNEFTFEDIECNIDKPVDYLFYSPQLNIGTEQFLSLNTGDPFTLSVTCGGANNVYQWYKDGMAIIGAQSPDYVITAAELTDAGDYTCQVTNTVAIELTIYSNPFHVSVTSNTDSQHTFLQTGWNIFSLYVTPDNIAMMSIVQPLIDNGTLVKVQSETGAAIEYVTALGTWIDNIGNWSATESYKIKVNAPTYLNLTGTIFTDPVAIDLLAGWNIVGYPSSTSQDAMEVLNDLITSGSLMKVQDETGAAIEPMPFELGWINNIGTFDPGEGYKVRVAANDILTISPTGTGGLKATRPAPGVPLHFKKTWEGNGYDHMNIYLSIAEREESSLQPSDEIGVYDGELCVGAIKIGNQDQHQKMYALAVSADDPTTEAKDGFTAGNGISFRIWNEAMNTEIQISSIEFLTGYSGVFEPMGTTAAILGLGNMEPGAGITSLGDNYPNPFNLETTIPFTIGEKTKVDLSIYDVLGQRLATLVNSTREAGSYEITWDGSDNRREKLKPGIYFCRMVAGNKVLVKTIEVID
ncbi:MAG: S8 family serine peptidase [Bacteroidales bacterium]|nr:S8 family serine peptidase [Bacteroidales bacterium]